MSNKEENKPWLDKNGEPLSLFELREASKRWDTKTWNAYGDWLEYFRREHLASDFDDLVKKHDREEALRRYFEAECGDSPSEDQTDDFEPNAIARALSNLSHLEREVLLLRFWEGKTEREIAESLEHSKSKIRRTYELAMKKMREMRTKIQDPQNLGNHLIFPQNWEGPDR